MKGPGCDTCLKRSMQFLRRIRRSNNACDAAIGLAPSPFLAPDEGSAPGAATGNSTSMLYYAPTEYERDAGQFSASVSSMKRRR
jgi:hypothetical protein